MKRMNSDLTPIQGLYRLAWLLFFAFVLHAPAQAQSYEVADDRGVSVRFDAPPRRVVSLLPSLTETVCAIGACDRLVGVDRYSNWPEAVRRLPQVGGGLDPNVCLLYTSPSPRD